MRAFSADPRTRGAAVIIAFLASTSGSGRTSALANVAWLLAGAGRRVLVVDWSSEASSVQEYLEPFHIESLPLGIDLVRAYSPLLSSEDVKPQSIQRYALPAGSGRIDVIGDLVSEGRLPVPVGAELRENNVFSELRQQLRRSGYDYVLVDAPPGREDGLATAVGILCDAAAVCFVPRHRAIVHAAELSRLIHWSAPNSVRIIPVATMFDDRYSTKAEQSRNAIRAAFTDLVDPLDESSESPGIVEIPYHTYGVLFEPILAVLADDGPGQPLINAYQRLATAVAGAHATGISVVANLTAKVRARYRRAFRLSAVTEPDRMLIGCLPGDRIWAEWVWAQLEWAGAQAELWPLDGDPVAPPGAEFATLIAIVSPDLSRSPAAGPVGAWLGSLSQRQEPLDVVQLMPAPDGPAVTDSVRALSLAGLDEVAARAALLTYFGLANRSGTPAPPVRFPAEPPVIRQLPVRSTELVGREPEIEALRSELLDAGGGQVVVTVAGPPGVGKTALVAEYARRFAAGYDVVWWIPAQDREAILTSLTDLARELHRHGLSGMPVAGAFDVLGERPDTRHWLLVYDGAAATALEELLPSWTAGHVVITRDEPVRPAIELGPMPRASAVTALTTWVAGLTRAEAERIAALLGDLPLALDIAARWLLEWVRVQREAGAATAEATRSAAVRLVTQIEPKLAAAVAPTPYQVVDALLDVVLDELEHGPQGPAAIALGRFCAFVSPEGARLHLLRSPAVLAWLVRVCGPEAESLRYDVLELDEVFWIGTRCGLFHVAWDRSPTLRVHPLVQTVLRERMSASARDELRDSVLDCLAAYAPTETDTDLRFRASRFAELQRHLTPSSALYSGNRAVRRWLVDHARYLYTDGNAGVWRSSLPMVSEVFARWTEESGPTDELRCRLGNQLANLYRALGEFGRALELDRGVLRDQRRSTRLTHPRTLITARGRAADLRGLGRFADALTEDQATWRSFVEELGEDHPQTRSAANNLALAMYLGGDTGSALEREVENHIRLVRLVGGDGPVALWSLCAIGIYQRELGRYGDAVTTLRQALEDVRRLRSPNHPDELRIMWNHAIALRRMGQARAARERTLRALRGFQDLLGPHHPDALACQLSLAADYAASGRHEQSVELATQVLEAYRTRLTARHPFMWISRVQLGHHLLRTRRSPDEVLNHSRQGWEGLHAALGGQHPWSLAARIDYAMALAVSGRQAPALEHNQAAYEDCMTYLGEAHPYTEAAAANAGRARTADGDGGKGWRYLDIDVPQT